jgi:hypothetical protein
MDLALCLDKRLRDLRALNRLNLLLVAEPGLLLPRLRLRVRGPVVLLLLRRLYLLRLVDLR